ncbi:bifunctional hydroxymethylpyrimidine kinase/phosphomethylpyrimidine kinase [Weissella soli]|uniref:bifunctional hydroxymethylpyrimidine kinase/phosphomethylpyrimidine kinase n=1 Tax=Weissella soli TaxID=155866 RepID=UPI001F354F09|nr:bifunctional hydroxymethylpyrimidine kinase/phosphomethylpyrimidine kinase [Weissella soli]GJM48627.1 hydroxymethylpyrimidine/phosphomethylpyrimidine kinase [Weissella soli]
MIEVPQVVTIAGMDSGGGAGINADLKTFHNQRVYAASIVVGLTAQNTYGVQALLPTPSAFLHEQFESVAADFEIKAVKTGALFDAEHVHQVVQELADVHFGAVVVDPVMVAKGGAKLLTNAAIALVKTELLPLATVITPNLEEAQVLLDRSIETEADIMQAASALQALGAKHVLIKGGHAASATVVRDYALFADGSSAWYTAPRIDTVRTHGTGDTLSAYITANLAKGLDIKDILPAAKQFTYEAIKQSINVGHGHGPLNHWVEG